MPIDTGTKYVIKTLAQPSWRGFPLSNIVCRFQDAVDEIKSTFNRPSLYHDADATRYYLACLAGGLLKEIKRRSNIPMSVKFNTDPMLLQSIKECLPIEDVIEWYTEVFYTSKDRLKYKCNIHGEDKHPSGVIYVSERRYHCFVCNKGGDVFDAVMLWERVELPTAIAKLARYVGIDIKPLTPKAKPKGGIEI